MRASPGVSGKLDASSDVGRSRNVTRISGGDEQAADIRALVHLKIGPCMSMERSRGRE
jgi:hypothetical protein